MEPDKTDTSNSNPPVPPTVSQCAIPANPPDISVDASERFALILHRFMERVEAIHQTSLWLLPVIEGLRNDMADDYNKFIGNLQNSAPVILPNHDQAGTVAIPPDKIAEYRRLKRRISHIDNTNAILPETMIVTLVSLYDAFLGALIAQLFRTRPEILSASERPITFAELTQYKTIEEARARILESEVETVLRKSHAEHFQWLENKLSMKLRQGLAIWPSFIELTERRNLFVHTEGITSSHYIEVCNEHNVVFDKRPIVGDHLDLNPAYLKQAYETIAEIGFKLGQVIWRKLLKKDVDAADGALNELALELIRSNQYKLAITMLEFPLAIKKQSSATYEIIFKINLAQAHKWNKEDAKCRGIVGAIDWGPLALKFQLAKFVLEDDFAGAAAIMTKIGVSGEVGDAAYRDWPIFRDFRKSQEFIDAYSQIFKKPFQIQSDPQIPMLPVQIVSENPPSEGATEEPIEHPSCKETSDASVKT